MEPKIQNEGHGYYCVKFWSYRDQKWKKGRGTTDIYELLKEFEEFWPRYLCYIAEKLAKDGFKLLSLGVRTKTLYIYGEFNGVQIRLKTRRDNLLSFDIKSVLPQDVSALINGYKKALLDDDFDLTVKPKYDINKILC